jgi:uncharacterized membrane protein YfcA
MSALAIIVLFAANFAAGIMNTIAGGGSFLTFPSLLFSGLDPRAANITSTLALFPMQVSSGYAGRQMAGGTQQLSFKVLIVISLIGGIIGALLLLITPPAFFAKLVPWLIMLATAIFAYGSFVKKPGDLAAEYKHMGKTGSMVAQFGISIYGGYFGGGIGFLMLAALTLAGMHIRKAGATKNILAAVMNASAVFIFLFSHDIGWLQVGIGAAASILGGLLGVRMLRVVNERILRITVVVIGSALTLFMFMY